MHVDYEKNVTPIHVAWIAKSLNNIWQLTRCIHWMYLNGNLLDVKEGSTFLYKNGNHAYPLSTLPILGKTKHGVQSFISSLALPSHPSVSWSNQSFSRRGPFVDKFYVIKLFLPLLNKIDCNPVCLQGSKKRTRYIIHHAAQTHQLLLVSIRPTTHGYPSSH